jgi:hypothetical protein
VRRAVSAVAVFLAGAVVGGAVMLSVPVPGMPDGHGPTRRPSPATPVLGRAPVTTLLAWTPGSLPPGYAEAVRQHPAARRVAVVRSGVAWLDRWTAPSGRPGSTAPGYRIPVEIAAVRPRSYAAFVPPADRTPIRGSGAVLASRSFADDHGLGPGATLILNGIRLTIDEVIDDDLVGAHEVVVDPHVGARLGVTRDRYLLAAPVSGGGQRLEAALRRLVPPGIRVRVRAPGETPVFRHGDAVLPQVRVKELFGEFSARQLDGGLLQPHPSWVRENIRTARVPVLGRIRCHRVIVPLVRAALEDLARRGLGHLVDPSDYGGCYFPRFIARDPGTGLSHHSWGIALDINVSQGLPGRQPTIDRRLVEAFEAQGFKWGGEFLIPDGTHFEFIRFP